MHLVKFDEHEKMKGQKNPLTKMGGRIQGGNEGENSVIYAIRYLSLQL